MTSVRRRGHHGDTLQFRQKLWSIDPAQARELSNQTNHFFKNLTIMGALIFIIGMGSGPLGLERSNHKG